jgi:sugar phosphate isomerase/epimerase
MMYICSSASTKDNIRDAVTELAERGFLNIELGGGTKYYDGIDGDIAELKEKYKLNLLIHNYFPPARKNFVMNITSRDEDIRGWTLNQIDRALELIKRWGGDLYTMHPGYDRSMLREVNGRFYEETEPGKRACGRSSEEDFYKAIDLLSSRYAKDGVRIGIENLFPFFTDVRFFLEDAQGLMEFLGRYNKLTNIGLLLDLSHLDMAAVHLGFDKFDVLERIFAQYPRKIFEIHVSENDGRQDLHGVTSLDSWQMKFLKKNKKRLGGVPISFEWRRSCGPEAYERFTRLNEQFY